MTKRISNFLKRLPVIRHVRALVAAYRVDRHYRFWSDLGMAPVHQDRDEEIVRKIWRGEL